MLAQNLMLSKEQSCAALIGSADSKGFIKAISLWEPWASLIFTKAKRFETRSWQTRYRGKLLICAAKGGIRKSELRACLDNPEFQIGLCSLVAAAQLDPSLAKRIDIEHLNFGMAVAIVDLTDCIPTAQMSVSQIGTDMPFGDYSAGRFAWKLENITAITPFAVTGRQGLFNVDLKKAGII